MIVGVLLWVLICFYCDLSLGGFLMIVCGWLPCRSWVSVIMVVGGSLSVFCLVVLTWLLVVRVVWCD